MRDPWTIACCALCGQPAKWLPIDRIAFSWQCDNPDHGYRYLSEKAGTLEWVKVVPAKVIEGESAAYQAGYEDAMRDKDLPS